MLGGYPWIFELYFGGSYHSKGSMGLLLSLEPTSNLHVCDKCCDQTFNSGSLLGLWARDHFCGSTFRHSSLSVMSSSVLFLFELWGNSHLKIRLWHLSKLLSPREHTHPPVGRLKRAIDSSKKSQIKTRLQTVGREKKTAPPQSNVKRLATWKREVVQRVVRKKDEV